MPANLAKLEAKIGYSFNDKSILKEAMTHGSVRNINRDLPNYQRLEFLGDAILYTVISEYFFKERSLADPGSLTDERKALICDAKQVQIAAELGIRDYVEFGHGININAFKRDGEFIEALIGAVYVDAGMGNGAGMKKAQQLIFKLWKLEEQPSIGACVIT